MSLELVALLVLVAVVAGFVDAIAGGGGLLTVPALLLAGLDPVAALATNKLQSSFGSATATLTFYRHGHIDLFAAAPMIVTTLAGACLGALAVSVAPLSLLSAALPVLLIIMAGYFALSPKLRDQDSSARISPRVFALTAAPLVGFYDGVFGPGTGSFFFLAFVTLLGYGVVRATASTKLLNFTSNIASLCLFAISGNVAWMLGLAMGAGQYVGATLGSRLAMRQGARLIRPLLILVCVGMALRLIADPGNPLHRWLAGLA